MQLNDRELLAKTLQAEAGNQGIGGMLAVGSVIRNRMKQGGSLSDVILAPAQFSAWNKVTGAVGGEQGQDMAALKPSKDAYAAADAILSGSAPDITGGATHYYNPSISNPAWGKEKAGGDWTKIGSHIFGKAGDFRTGAAKMNGNQKQQTQMAQPQQSQGLLGGLLGGQGIGGALGLSDDFRDRLKMGLLLGSDPQRFAPLVAGMQQAAKERRAEAKEQRQRNKSLEYLKQRADAGDALAKQYYEAASTGVLPVGAGISGYLTDSQAAPKTYQYQALAKDLLEKGLAKNETEALQMALSQTKAAPTVQVSYGDKGGPPKAFEKVDNEFAKEAVQWSSGGAADAMKNLTQIRDVITDINMAVSEGRTPSGPLVGIQNDVVQSFINPEATDIRNRVQEVVQRNLREILGAQFTQAEGLALIERAYNQRLSPEQNLRRLNSLLEQMATAATAKQQMYDYFMDKGTLFGYRAENTLPTLDELHGVMDAFDRQQGVSTSDLRPKSKASKSNISEADAIVGINK